jgi:hypothetical protein
MTMTETAPWMTDLNLRGLDPGIKTAVRELAKELWTFRWIDVDSPDDNRGEVEVYAEGGKARLELAVWVHDTEHPEVREVSILRVNADVTTAPAQEQIRSLIHWYLCHEADECLSFDDVIPFWPHEHEVTNATD